MNKERMSMVGNSLRLILGNIKSFNLKKTTMAYIGVGHDGFEY